MGRFFVILLLAVALAGGVAYYNEWGPFAPTPANPDGAESGERNVRPDFGKPLYAVTAPAFNPIVDGVRGRHIVIPDCHLVPLKKQEVTSAKEGLLKIIGHPVELENPLATQALPTISIWVADKKREIAFEELKENFIVSRDQIVALVDPTKALNDIEFKQAKIKASEAEYKAAVAMAEEAQARLARLDDLKRQGSRLVSAEDYSAAVLTRDKHREESVSKKEQVEVARIDKAQSVADFHQHEIRCVMEGKSIVSKIYKSMGEGVKNLEPVMLLQNISRLRAEGAVDAQYFDLVRKGLKVIVEPSHEMAPDPDAAPIKAHRGEISGVAVAADGTTFVSGSEDRAVYVWRRGQREPVDMLRHSSPVRAVACTPAGSKRNLCAVGLADGRIVLWDLAQAGKPGLKPLQELKDAHRDTVSALAFSPDGRWFASGGGDNMIFLWQTGQEKPLYPFHPDAQGLETSHGGMVTALHFTPDSKLVSAARDHLLRVWDLREKGAALDGEPVKDRSGTVANPGVTAAGNLMVFDQGRSLQLLSVKDQRPMAELDSSSAAVQFETFALFSPDGALMLTAGGPEGRLQLWRTPTAGVRGYEVRQLVPRDRSAATCAAFAPGGQFAVSGSKDGRVYVWNLPTRQQVEEHRIRTDKDGQPLTLTLVDRALDANKIRIGVEMQNPETPEHPNGRLIPGRRVTVVVEQ
jgi:WD40 repeat protein